MAARTGIAAALAAALAVVTTLPAVPAAAETATRPVAFSDLAGWANDRHASALAAFRRGCAVIRPAAGGAVEAAMRAACLEAIQLGEDASDADAREFFEARFEPRRVLSGAGETGLFTGYFEPELDASRTTSPAFTVPILAPPDRTGSAPTRAEIDAGALDGRARPLAWLADPIDAFFLHVQGSGRLRFVDGTSMRVSFAAKNGHPYTSIGAVLVSRGVMTREEVSMASLRAWLAADPARARELMHQNNSYIFFRALPIDDPTLGPEGQLQVPLTAGRSLAVDRAYHEGNLPVWLETTVPDPAGGPDRPLARLMVAQDTGSAIKGAVRGDIFFGSGDEAGALAGLMRSEGRMTILVPR